MHGHKHGMRIQHGHRRATPQFPKKVGHWIQGDGDKTIEYIT